MKKLVLVLVIALTMGTFAFAQGKAEAEIEKAPVSVYRWGENHWDAAIQMSVDELKKTNPDVKYTISAANYNAYWDQLTLDISSGTNKDVIMLDAPTSVIPYHKLQKGGTFLDLSKYVEASPVLSKLNGLTMGNFEGKQLAIPAVMTGWAGIWYRKSHFEAAGIDPNSIKTWDDLLDAAQKLCIDTDGDGINDQFGIGFGAVNEAMIRWWSQQFFWAVGGGWFEDDSNGPYTAETVNFDSPQNIFVMEYLKKLQDTATPPGTRNHFDGRVLFTEGVVSMVLDGSYGAGIFKGLGDVFNDIAAIPFPGVNYNGKYYKPVAPSWGLSWAVSSKTKNVEGALKFIETNLSLPIQSYLAEHECPANPEALSIFKKGKFWGAKFIEWGASDAFVPVSFPINDHFNELDKVHQEVLANVLVGIMTPAEAAAYGQKEMVRIMSGK